MSYQLIIKEEAREEILEGWLWYEKRVSGLGDRFEAQVDRLFERIKEAPFQFPVEYKSFRQAVVKNFPYVVTFEIEDETVVIYAVFHTSQDPVKKF